MVWSRQRKHPSALAFFDLKQAFYRVIRQTLVPTPCGSADKAFQALLYDLGVPHTAMAELVSHLEGMAVIADAKASPHLVARTADLFRGSWFRLQGETALQLTRRGTRPGDPLADLLFAYSFAACARAIEEALDRSGLATRLPIVVEAPPWHSWTAARSEIWLRAQSQRWRSSPTRPPQRVCS